MTFMIVLLSLLRRVMTLGVVLLSLLWRGMVLVVVLLSPFCEWYELNDCTTKP